MGAKLYCYKSTRLHRFSYLLYLSDLNYVLSHLALKHCQNLRLFKAFHTDSVLAFVTIF